MADFYVRSTDGSDADNGSTWALAKATIASALSASAAGGRVFASQSHAETSATALTLTMPGTGPSPTQLICGDDASAPPTTLASTATITTTAAVAITVAGSGRINGLNLIVGSGVSTSCSLILGGTAAAVQVFENSSFRVATTSASGTIQIGAGSSTARAHIRWNDCTVQFGNVGQRISQLSGSFVWTGGSIVGATIPTILVAGNADPRASNNTLIDRVDLTALGANAIFDASTRHPGQRNELINCLLHASTVLVSGSFPLPGCRVSAYSCDNTDKTYRFQIRDFSGSIDEDTGIYVTSGEQDVGAIGTPQSYSVKMVSNASCNRHVAPLRSDDFGTLVTTVGVPITLTIEVAGPSGLTDADLYAEFFVTSTTGSVRSTLTKTECGLLATAAALTSSTTPWTGASGLTLYKLTATVTPRVAGALRAKVVLCKPSTTVYFNEDAV